LLRQLQFLEFTTPHRALRSYWVAASLSFQFFNCFSILFVVPYHTVLQSTHKNCSSPTQEACRYYRSLTVLISARESIIRRVRTYFARSDQSYITVDRRSRGCGLPRRWFRAHLREELLLGARRSTKTHSHISALLPQARSSQQ